MRKNRFDNIPDLGEILISGPLYQWLNNQNSNHVTLSYAQSRAADASLGTQPLRHLKWQMVLFYDDHLRARFGWRLASGGTLSDTEVVRYMEEVFSE